MWAILSSGVADSEAVEEGKVQWKACCFCVQSAVVRFDGMATRY